MPSDRPECSEVDARRVGEEDDGQRRFGDGLDLDSLRRRVDEPERIDADDQSGGGEKHRRRDRGSLDAARDPRRSRGG